MKTMFGVINMLCLFCIMNRSNAGVTIGRDTALSIAKQEATRLEYDVEHMRDSIDSHPIIWDSLAAIHREFRNIDNSTLKQYKKKLRGKAFWVVYFTPHSSEAISQERVLVGGDIWIFIDSTTGKILNVIRGK